MESVEVAPNSAYTKINEVDIERIVFLRLTVIACVGPTNRWGVHACLSSHSQGVIAVSGCCRGGKPRECLEVQPQLTNVSGFFANCECTGGGTGCCVAAWVSRVPDVGGVGAD